MSLIKDRFDPRDYNVYVNCEQLLLKAATGGDAYKDEFQTVTSLYGSDFDPRELEAHLNTHNIPRVENVTLSNVLVFAIFVFTPATAVVTGHQISQINSSHASYKHYQ